MITPWLCWGSDHIAAKNAIYPIKMQKCVIDRSYVLPPFAWARIR